MARRSLLSAERLRALCIRKNWFTAGTNSQYNKLFALNRKGASAEELALVIWVCSENADRDAIKAELTSESLVEHFANEKAKADDRKFDIAVRRTCSVTGGDMFDLVVAALDDDGIRYWAKLDDNGPEFKNAPEYETVAETAAKVICNGGNLIFKSVFEDEKWELTADKLVKGIRCYIENGYDRCGIFKDDTADMSLCNPDCADTIVQLALFGKISFPF